MGEKMDSIASRRHSSTSKNDFHQREQLLDHPESIPSRQVTPDTYLPLSVKTRRTGAIPPGGSGGVPARDPTSGTEPRPALTTRESPCPTAPWWTTSSAERYSANFLHTLEGYPVDLEKYQSRVEEISRGLTGFSSRQDYQRYYHANWIARSEQYNKAHSAMSRMKNIFTKRH